jgi:hypothetical protein
MQEKLSTTPDECIAGEELDIAYQRMAREEAREAEALEWAEVSLEVIADEGR